MLPFIFSTIHWANLGSMNHTSAALSWRPGWSGSTLHCVTVPYWPKRARTCSSAKFNGKPATKSLSWPGGAPPAVPVEPAKAPRWPQAAAPAAADEGAADAPLHVVASYFARWGLKRHSTVTVLPCAKDCPSLSWFL